MRQNKIISDTSHIILMHPFIFKYSLISRDCSFIIGLSNKIQETDPFKKTLLGQETVPLSQTLATKFKRLFLYYRP